MTWTLVVTSHGRWPYLEQMMRSVADLDFEFDRCVYSFDGVHDIVLKTGMAAPSDIVQLTTGSKRQGLTANLTQAWGALGSDEWVFHVEEDFLIHDAPLDEMRRTLEANPTVANMVLVRQPWGQHEIAAGSVLAAQPYELLDRGGWLQHQGGFWLNPFVAHSSTLRQLTPGVETSLTKQCLRLGLSFGYWGSVTDPPRCTHIGAQGGMGSPEWLP